MQLHDIGHALAQLCHVDLLEYGKMRFCSKQFEDTLIIVIELCAHHAYVYVAWCWGLPQSNSSSVLHYRSQQPARKITTFCSINFLDTSRTSPKAVATQICMSFCMKDETCFAVQIFMTFCMEANNSMPQPQHPFAPQLDPFQLPDPNNRPLVVDGSLWLHAPKALLWLVTEATVIALSCYDHYVGKP